MSEYDAIIIGARVAGSPTAMLLARQGHRVLLVDRATFPSDTISSHLIHPPGMAALDRWGLADAVIATGCPPVTAYRLDFGPFAIAGQPRGVPGGTTAYAPRRTVLDALLVEAASAAGAEVREGYTVESLVVDDGRVRGIRGRAGAGTSSVDSARVVIGADGVHSIVARAVDAEPYRAVPALEALYLAYWEDLPTDGEFQLYAREGRGFGFIPTNDGLTVAVVTWPADEFDANRRDLLGNYLEAFEVDAELADRVADARRASNPVGMLMANFYRQSFGPGWALVGDAGYHKDAVTAQGISDAFRDAEAVASIVDAALSGGRPWDLGFADYQAGRDAATSAMFELTCQLASPEPPDDQTAGLFSSIAAEASASADFASVLAGSMAVEDLFNPEYLATFATPSVA
jgi:2-polyprenyl-6-methoxyphenol hydroxylase-like FAD-dependent oxidoreductase